MKSRKPIWRVFAVFFGVFLLEYFLFVLIWQIMKSHLPPSNTVGFKESLREFEKTTIGYVLASLTTFISTFLMVTLATRKESGSLIQNLGFEKTKLSGKDLGFLALGNLFCVLVGILLVEFVVEKASITPRVFPAIVSENVLLVLLAVAVITPLAEEILLRGYLQRRLLQHLSPWICIAISSVVFSILHGPFYYQLLVLPSGIYMGLIAWRTGSILPTVLCHAFNNGLFGTVGFLRSQGSVSDSLEIAVGSILGFLGLLGFVASIKVLRSPSSRLMA